MKRNWNFNGGVWGGGGKGSQKNPSQGGDLDIFRNSTISL